MHFSRKSMAAILMLGLVLWPTIGCGFGSRPSVVGSGVAASDTRVTGEFTAVTSNLGADLDITVGPATEVVIQADDNILPLISTEIRGKELVISSNSSISTRTPIKITIKTPTLSGLVINGAGNAVIAGMTGDSFDGMINGAGNITATGKVQKLQATINGSGDLRFAGLATSKASISINGSGNATVDSTESLQASITGSGDIRYKPAPNLNIQKQIVGSGSVRPI